MVEETPGSDVLVEDQTDRDLIPMYKIIMWDDNSTTMDFVVAALNELFDKTHAEAISLMMEIHNNGNGIIAVMPLEQAEFKVDQVHARARASGFPLQCTIQKN